MSDTPRGTVVARRTGYGITIDQADDEILISLRLIADMNSELTEVSGDCITFLADNGSVHYRIIGWDPYAYALIAERVAR